MSSAFEQALAAAHKGTIKACLQCTGAVLGMDKLTTNYPELAKHVVNVLETRAATLTLGDTAHFESEANTITLPHTGEAKDVDDLVDGFLFESYNAVRKDRFDAAKGSKELHDIVAHGRMTAQIEAETMTDFYDLAISMGKEDLTANMQRCVKLVGDNKKLSQNRHAALSL